MKAQILKIAGVKNEKEFYQKFPTEEAFMKKHRKEFEKARNGKTMKKAEGGITQSSQAWRNANYSPQMQPMGSIGTPQLSQPLDLSLQGLETTGSGFDWDNAFTKGIPVVGKLAEGFSQLKQEKKRLQKAKQWNQVSDVVRQASAVQPEEVMRQYVRPEDMDVTGEQLYPIYGTGTNVLAKSGIHIKPENKGKFTATKKATGKTTEELTHSKNPLTRKRAVFAQNAKKWKHEDGGELLPISANLAQVPQELMPVDMNRMYSKKYTYRDNGPTYYDEAIRLDKELQDAEGKLKRARIDGSKAKWEGKIREAKQAKYDLLSHQYENFRNGGELEQANFGQILSAFDQAGGTDKVSGLITNFTGENAGGSLGGTIGETIGSFAGPVGSVVGQIGGQLIGTLLDKNPQRIKKQQNAMNRNIGAAAINNWSNNRDSSFMRTGGNIRQNNMDELEVYNGKAETLSYNPFLPDKGETVMFKGPSHAEGGMPISYGEQGVEVEGGEPAVKLDGEDLVVFGNLSINKDYANLLGDKKAQGKKFKNYIADLSKEENKANNKLDKSMEALSKIRVKSPHDKLTFSSHKANILGSNMKLKEIADKKQNAADLQKAINDYKDETGMKAKNGMTVAKDGEVLTNAERDYLEALYRSAQKKGTGESVKLFQEEFHRLAPERAKEILAKYPVTNYGKEQGLFNTDLASNTDAIFGKRTEQYVVPPNIGEAPEFTPIGYNAPEEASTSGGFNVSSINDNYAKAALLAQMLPYLRPSDAEALDPRQLAGELYSLSQNQLEPVYAQKYSPDLGTPYDISLQDQLNANQADYRATERTIGYNPAALSILNAQKYKANQQVLGEQFRLNQAEKDKVYGENRNTLNQAKLQNLQILDNQYVRQATAKSNTKDAKLAALNSISSKFLQNKLENRTLQTYENLYNYRYDDKGRAINMNAPALFNIQGSGTGSSNTNDYIESDWKKLYNSDGSFDRYVKKTKSDDAISMNGTILKSYKSY